MEKDFSLLFFRSRPDCPYILLLHLGTLAAARRCHPGTQGRAWVGVLQILDLSAQFWAETMQNLEDIALSLFRNSRRRDFLNVGPARLRYAANSCDLLGGTLLRIF